MNSNSSNSSNSNVNGGMTEVERVALALLGQHRVDHPGLAMYIRALTNDPSEVRILDQFIYEYEENGERTLWEFCNSNGYAVWQTAWDRSRSALDEILGRNGGFWAALDRAALHLDMAVRRCREHDEDVASLVEAIVEYHQRVVSAYADRS